MKRLNFDIKDRKILYGILVIVLICVFTLTIAYAALNAVLTISGNAEVSASSWKVYLYNIHVTSGSVKGADPTISSNTVSFSTTLNRPGDFYEFAVDVKNDGTIDAMIDGITKSPTLTEAQAKYLKYEITYQNGDSINNKQLVQKKSFVRLKVRLEYRKDLTADDLPVTTDTLNLAFTVNYTQSDGSGSNVTDNGVKTISFTIDGITYLAEEGQNWYYWTGSKYNTGGFYINDYDEIALPGGCSVIGTSTYAITKNELIRENFDYTYFVSPC